MIRVVFGEITLASAWRTDQGKYEIGKREMGGGGVIQRRDDDGLNQSGGNA